jgi:hypothetical protein
VPGSDTVKALASASPPVNSELPPSFSGDAEPVAEPRDPAVVFPPHDRSHARSTRTADDRRAQLAGECRSVEMPMVCFEIRFAAPEAPADHTSTDDEASSVVGFPW